MAGEKPRFLFFNGRIIPYDDARVHVLSTAFKYAAVVFEGIRAYHDETTGRLFIFRLREHLERLAQSTMISRIPLNYSEEELTTSLVELIRANGLRQDLHIRISAYIAEDDGKLDSVGEPGLSMAAMPMGRYEPLGAGQGLSVGVSSWRRIGDEAMPPRVKATGNYNNSRLALLDARAAGFQDAILLDQRGKVTEGPGYNIFIVRDGKVLTPPVTAGILEGVTRDTLIRLFAEMHGIGVIERDIDRTELYIASEAFFCGSGKEVTPIGAVDRRKLAGGTPGKWTSQIRDTYFDVAKGRHQAYLNWLTPVYD